MDATALIIVVFVLLIILVILVATFFMMRVSTRRSEVSPSPVREVKKATRSFRTLADILKDKRSSDAELLDAVEELVTSHGRIKEKLGIRPHPDFDRYIELIFAVCRHKNTSKEIVLALDKGLSDQNPTYRLEIDAAVQKALTSRGM